MKFVLKYIDNLHYRPSYKFYLNLFFLKTNYYFLLKHTQYIQIFLNLKNLLRVRLFKFNYSFYNIFLSTFVLINTIIQISLYFIIIKWI